jgi:acetyl esterase/lipase
MTFGAGLDPAMFRPEAIDPQTASFNADLASRLAGLPPVWSAPASVTRAAREAGRGAFGPLVLSERAVDRTIPGSAGPIRLRTFLPETIAGVYLHLHGGGFTLGAAHHNDPMLDNLAQTAHLAVLSADYRLAPEDPYPAGPDDCEAVAVWLAEHAAAEFGTSRLAIGGDSAGANLSATTLLRLRDRHGFRGFQAAILTYGVFDLSGTPSAVRCPDSTLIINRQAISWFNAQYVAAADPRSPDLSPLYADLADLPPALFTVGTADPLLDDTLFMHARWLAAGNRAELAVYPGAVHGFTGFDYRQSYQARAQIAEFLAQSLGTQADRRAFAVAPE